MRLVGRTALATLLFLGCGRSDPSGGLAAGGTATVRFYVKDMGERLKLL
jgi:hypothetical protein